MKTYLMPMTKVMNLNVNAAIMDEEPTSGTITIQDGGADAAPFL